MIEFKTDLKRWLKDIGQKEKCYIPPDEFEKALFFVIYEREERRDFVFKNVNEFYFKSLYVRALFIVCRDLYEKKKKIDIGSLLLHFPKDQYYFADNVIFQSNLLSSMLELSNGAILEWCKKQRERYLDTMFDDNYRTYGRQRAIEIQDSLLEEMQISDSSKKIGDMSDQITKHLEYLERVKNNGGIEGYRTFDFFDDVCGGLVPGDLITIAARPGGFKTGFAQNMVIQAVRKNKGLKACFINLEMPSDQMIPRFVQAYFNITKREYMRWDINKQLQAINEVFGSKRIISTEAMHVNGQELVYEMERYYEEGYRVFVIDYIQLVKSKNNYGVREDLRIQEAVQYLKEFKDSHKEAHITCLAQMNRESEKYEKPTMAALKGSSYLEEASALVMLNCLPKESESRKDLPELMNSIIAKNRHGQITDLGVVIDKSRMYVLNDKEALQWAKENEL